MQKSLNIQIAFNAKTGKLEVVNQKLSSLKNKSNSAKKGVDGLKRSFDNFLPSIKSLAAGALAGIGLEKALRSIITTGADFERTMLSVKAKTGATSTEFDALTTKAKELGSSTEFSSKQVAEGMDFLSMAGFNTEQILGSVNSVMDLATVGMTDLGVASDIASNILSGFSMNTEETARIVDVMAKATTSANTNIPELGNAMKYVAPIASGLGVSLEEATASIMSLSNAGIKGEQAGTTMRTMLNSLAAPTKTAKDSLNALSISVSDLSNKNGELRPLSDIVGILNSKMQGLSQTAKANALKNIFGTEAMSGAIVLLKEGKTGLENYTTSLENAKGAATDMAEIMRSGVGASMDSVSSAAEGVLLSIFDLMKEDLKGWLDSASSALQSMKTWIDTNKSAISSMVSAVKTVGAAFAVWRVSSWIGFLTSMSSGFIGMGAGALGAVTKVRLLSGALNLLKANPIGIALTAATAAYTYFSSESENAEEKTKNLNSAVTAQGVALNKSKSALEGLLDAKKAIIANEKLDAEKKAILLKRIEDNIKRTTTYQKLLSDGKKIVTSATDHAIKETKRKSEAIKRANDSMLKQQEKAETELLKHLNKMHDDYFKTKVEKLNDWTNAQVKEINKTIKNEKKKNEALATLGDIAYKKYSDLEEKKSQKAKAETLTQEKIYDASVTEIGRKYGLGFTGIDTAFGSLTNSINEKTLGLSDTLTSRKGGLTKIGIDFSNRFANIVTSFDGTTGSIIDGVKDLGVSMAKNALTMVFNNSWADGWENSEKGFVEKLFKVDIPFLKFSEGTIWGNGNYGVVSGNSPFYGDDLRNDTIPALISPGEAVIPRSAVEANSDIVSMLISGARLGNFANGHAPSGLSGSNIESAQLSMTDGVFGLKGGGILGKIAKPFKKIFSFVKKIISKIGKVLWKIASPVLKPLMKNPALGFLAQIGMAMTPWGAALIPEMLTADLTSAGMTLASGGNLKDALGSAGISGMIAGAGSAVSSLIKTGSLPTSDLTAWETIKKFPSDIVDNLHGKYSSTKEAFNKITDVADLNGEFGTNMNQLSFDNMKKGFFKVGDYVSSWSSDKFEYLTSFFKNPARIFQYIIDHIKDVLKNMVMSITDISVGKFQPSLDIISNQTPLNMAPQIHAFAEGGIATKATLGVFGEAGDEAIIPLNRFHEVIEDKKMQARMKRIENKFDRMIYLFDQNLKFERKEYSATSELIRLKTIELKAGGLI